MLEILKQNQKTKDKRQKKHKNTKNTKHKHKHKKQKLHFSCGFSFSPPFTFQAERLLSHSWSQLEEIKAILQQQEEEEEKDGVTERKNDRTKKEKLSTGTTG